jgi:hypothetical protein
MGAAENERHHKVKAFLHHHNTHTLPKSQTLGHIILLLGIFSTNNKLSFEKTTATQ